MRQEEIGTYRRMRKFAELETGLKGVCVRSCLCFKQLSHGGGRRVYGNALTTGGKRLDGKKET